jgi:hypothetical protein
MTSLMKRSISIFTLATLLSGFALAKNRAPNPPSETFDDQPPAVQSNDTYKDLSPEQRQKKIQEQNKEWNHYERFGIYGG